MLEDYIFVDEDFSVIEKAGLHDDEVAEQLALKLSARHKKTVVCYKHIVTCDTFDLSALRERIRRDPQEYKRDVEGSWNESEGK